MEPSVLLVGASQGLVPAFQIALSRHGVFVESASVELVVDAVITAAPDLVLLMGEAARNCGKEVLAKLRTLPPNFIVPVVVLNDDAELDDRLRALESGAMAVIPRSASVDAVAERVAKLARDVPASGGGEHAELGEATLDELIASLAKRLRAGLGGMTVGSTAEDQPVRLVLGDARPLAQYMNRFVRALRRHVVSAEPIHYELGGSLPMAQSSGYESTVSPQPLGSIADLRMIVADDDVARVDAVAQALRARGATVIVTDLEPSLSRFERLRQVDATLFMVGDTHAQGRAQVLLDRARRDTRLRWPSLLMVRWEEVFSEHAGAPAVERFETTLLGLAEPERSLRQRAETGSSFEARLEATGPARCLRALLASGRSLRVTVENPRVNVMVDLSDGLVVGASATPLQGRSLELEGTSALAALLALASGRVRVEPVLHPATANIMAPIDVALGAAESEPPPILPSAFPAQPPPVSCQPGREEDEKDEETVAVELPPALLRASSHDESNDEDEETVAVPLSRRTLPNAIELPPPAGMAVASPNAVPLPAAVVPPTTGISANTPASSPIARILAWLEARHRELHAPRISAKTTVIVAALASLQGLGLVGLYTAVRSSESPVPASSAQAEVRAQAAAQPIHAAAVERIAAAKAPAATEKPKPADANAADASTPDEKVPPADGTAMGMIAAGPDGSGSEAEDCRTLLADNPPREGRFRGAARAQSRLGRTSIIRGDLTAAQAAFCRAATWAPDDPEIAWQLAQVFLLRRDGPKAKKWALRAVELAPSLRTPKEMLGDALARLGEHEAALGAWFEAAGLDPESESDVNVLLQRELKQADGALKRRNLVVAEKFFRRAVLLEPDNVRAATGLSYVLLALNDTDAAVHWARHAVKVTPAHVGARIALGDALKAAGDIDGAVMEWREASQLDPSSRVALQKLRRAGR